MHSAHNTNVPSFRHRHHPLRRRREEGGRRKLEFVAIGRGAVAAGGATSGRPRAIAARLEEGLDVGDAFGLLEHGGASQCRLALVERPSRRCQLAQCLPEDGAFAVAPS